MDFPNPTSVIQYPFRERSLARVYVRRDTDIPLELETPFILVGEFENGVLLDCVLGGFRGLDSSSRGSVSAR